MSNKRTNIGCSLSINSLKKDVPDVNADVVQVFLTPPRRLSRNKKSTEYLHKLGIDLVSMGVQQLAVHASYLINLSQPDARKAIDSLIMDIKECEVIRTKIDVVGVVVHMGKAVRGLSRDEAISNFIENVVIVLEAIQGKVPLLLETSAGQGNEIGFEIKVLASILRAIPKHLKNRIGICLDTCHIFTAGEYDISKNSSKYFTDLLSSIPKQCTKLIHMNDCKLPFGKRVDRHAPLGDGFFVPNTLRDPHPALREWVVFAVNNTIPIILETNRESYRIEIEHMRSLFPQHSALNIQIIQMLESMTRIEALGNSSRFKVRAYENAIQSIKCYPKEIETVDEAKQIKGIGTSIAKRIGELLENGNVDKITKFDKKLLRAVAILTTVAGIGEVMAKRLYDEHGISTLTELRKRAKDVLSPAQQLNLRHRSDLKKRVQREYVKEIETLLNENSIKGMVVGSYRRGCVDSKDVDYLVESTVSSDTIIDKLREIKILVGVLSQGKFKSMCLIRWRKQVIHLDLLLVNKKEDYVSMLLYFTGSKDNNIKMRKRAMELGLRLNEHGLFDTKTGGRIVLNSEAEAYEILGLRPLKPTER